MESLISHSIPDIDTIVDAFLQSIDGQDTTRATYKKAMGIYLNWIATSGRSLANMTPVDLLSYKDSLLKDNKSGLTVNLYLSVVRKFYKWTKSNNYYPNIADGISSVRTNRRTFRKMHLESEEGAQLLEYEAEAGNTSPADRQIALRNFAMINLMLRTGLRTIEVSRADVGDIVRKKGKRILTVWGKGHVEKDDFVVLTDEAYNPIKEYLDTRPFARSSDPLFVCEGLGSKGKRMSTRRIQAICKEGLRAIGLDGHEYSAHSLRHTTGTQILLNGGTMFDVQHVLRHSNPATSQLYVNTIMEDKRISDASEELLDKSFKK